MRLWHQNLLPFLDRQRLLAQHRECCALRGKGWGRKHATVNYVFTHPYPWLYCYHEVVMQEMHRRGYHVASEWHNINYHGKTLGIILEYEENTDDLASTLAVMEETGDTVYPEHNDAYLHECVALLKEKNAPIDFETIERKMLNNG